jgi:hypothetical protein
VKVANCIFGWLVVGILGFASCQLTPVKAEKSAPVFFPKGIFSTIAEADRFNAARYAKYLQALQEPSLYAMKSNPKAAVFRFLCLRTFGQPFVIRVEVRADGGGIVRFKATDGTGGYRPGDLVTDKTVKLDKKQTQVCLAKIDRANFWQLKTKEANKDLRDESQWVLEGVRDGKYNLVERQSPSRGAVRRLGLYFLKLSGEKIRNLD